jgi:hypothetical protein
VNSYSFDNLSCVALTCKGSESNLQWVEGARQAIKLALESISSRTINLLVSDYGSLVDFFFPAGVDHVAGCEAPESCPRTTISEVTVMGTDNNLATWLHDMLSRAHAWD